MKQDTKTEECRRTSFIFPESFHRLLDHLKLRYNKDKTYIVMEAVNEYVINREGLEEEV